MELKSGNAKEKRSSWIWLDDNFNILYIVNNNHAYGSKD